MYLPKHHINRHTIYNHNTLHLIGKCDVAMVLHIEVGDIYLYLFEASLNMAQEYNIIEIHIKYNKIHHLRFEEALNRSIPTS